MSLSNAQMVALAVVPKVTSALSIVGSLWIILEVLTEKDKQSMVYHRLLFVFSVIDLVISVAQFCGTWLMPSDASDVVFAVGNDATCSAQGFFVQIGSSLPIYNAMLAIYYMLVIQYSVTEQRLHRYYERWFHGIPIVFCLGTAIAGLPLGLYNEANLWCWIALYPQWCLESEDDCNGQIVSFSYQLGFFYVPLWTCFVVVNISLYTVYNGVRTKEVHMAKYDPTLKAEKNQDQTTITRLRQTMRLSTTKAGPRTQQVASQALLYVFTFYLTHIFATVNRVVLQVTGRDVYVLVLLEAIFVPLQGFFNFFIYRRPRYIRIRNLRPHLTRWGAFWECMKLAKIHVICPRFPSQKHSGPGEGASQPSTRCNRKRLDEIESDRNLNHHEKQLAVLTEMEVISIPSERSEASERNHLRRFVTSKLLAQSSLESSNYQNSARLQGAQEDSSVDDPDKAVVLDNPRGSYPLGDSEEKSEER